MTQFLEIFDPERWCVDFYSIARPAKDLCKEYNIKIGSVKSERENQSVDDISFGRNTTKMQKFK